MVAEVARQLGAAAVYRAILHDQKKTHDQSPYNYDWSSGNRLSINDKERLRTTDYDRLRHSTVYRSTKNR